MDPAFVVIDNVSCGSIVADFSLEGLGDEESKTKSQSLVDMVESKGLKITVADENGNPIALQSASIAVVNRVVIEVDSTTSTYRHTSTLPNVEAINKLALIVACSVVSVLVALMLLLWLICMMRRRNAKRREIKTLEHTYGRVDYSMCDIGVSHRISKLAGITYQSEPIF